MISFSVQLDRNPGVNKMQSTFKLSRYSRLNGSGFGTKSNFVYADDISKHALGAKTGNIGSIKIGIPGGITVSNDMLRGNNNAIKKDYFNSNDFPKMYINFPTPADSGYFACWFRYTNDDFAGADDWVVGTPYAADASVKRGVVRYKSVQAVPAGVDPSTDYSHVYWITQTNVWKLGRIGNTLDDPYHQNRYHHEFTGTIPTSQTSALYSTENGYAPYIASNQVSYNPLSLTEDTWHFYEIWATAGTLNGNDSTFEARINNIPCTRFMGGSFKTNSRPDGIRSILTPLCGLDNQWQVGKSKTQMWMNGIYTTASLQRIVMTDTADYNAATNWELQEDLEGGWTDNRIYYKPIKGSFVSGATAYLQIFNPLGVIIKTIQITVP